MTIARMLWVHGAEGLKFAGDDGSVIATAATFQVGSLDSAAQLDASALDGMCTFKAGEH